MTDDLHTRICHLGLLQDAWEDVLRKARTNGDPGYEINRFARQADHNLDRLADELALGTYRPKALTRVLVAKPDGGTRTLGVPAVRDRVVERAILVTVTPYVDPYLGHSSYAYREGIGVQDAVQALVRLREEGLHWVLRADVDNCFDTLPRQRALTRLAAMLPDSSLDALIQMLVCRPVRVGHRTHTTTGVPQGTSLSPLLSNIVLTHLDAALSDNGFAVVRYSDDFAVACSSPDEAQEAAHLAARALEEIGMTLGAEKTEVMSFEDGFCFLGEDFGPRYPPMVENLRADDSLRRVMYVARQGARIVLHQGRVVVESKDDEDLISVPKTHVARIVCFGSVGVTAGTRAWSLTNDVDVVFLSRNGSYQGQQLAAPDGGRIQRLRAQVAATDDPARCLPIAQAMIAAKIAHQITVLQRFTRRVGADALRSSIGTIRTMLELVPQASTADELLGLEGAAAAAYFPALGSLLPEPLRFSVRSRRPPRDVVNAALSYGYAILLGEAVSALVAAGLDPNIGVLHRDKERRPGLALDLIEELRPLIVDQAVIAAARRGVLTDAHGQPADNGTGIYLTQGGKQALTSAYEHRLLQVTSGALPGFTGSLRRHVYRQAQMLVRCVSDPSETWRGMSWR